MALNVSKTKYIIFHGRNKKVDMTNLKLEYNANAQHEQHDNSLISPLERYHDKHEEKNCRAYKLLGTVEPGNTEHTFTFNINLK